MIDFLVYYRKKKGQLPLIRVLLMILLKMFLIVVE